ncbi:MAG: tRNA uridine-5-carboxymethylaminomethyl(34) synthesis GTPase MnmE [Candidatus Marinimicrobia bacterium]|nr:tRNA uridine-5-carboxymethylaminomethyl(34) synthesis GTPase MnmE [Candidatus Neomarinimicrobiota bacterium]
MDINQTTIVALSTPTGYGAIGVIRLSGPESLNIAASFLKRPQQFKHKQVRFCKLYDHDTHLDDVLMTYFSAPRSFTGEDMVEISSHGSPYIIERVLEICIDHGATLAEPGEFTKRAYLNDKFDLAQAEGVDAIIHAKTKQAHETAKNLLNGNLGQKIRKIKNSIIDIIILLELELDFSDQEIEFTQHSVIFDKLSIIQNEILNLINSYHYGKMIKEGVKTVLIGSPNSGKSSLMNAFLNEERVIVSEIPGTTRDSIEESIRCGGYQFRLIDTAGIRDSVDEIENLGIERSLKALENSDIKLLLFDPANDNKSQFLKYLDKQTIVVVNKIDLYEPKFLNQTYEMFSDFQHIGISAKYHQNIHQLADLMVDIIKNKEPKNSDLFISIHRHLQALEKTAKELQNTLDSIHSGNPSELIVTDLRFALNSLDEILGKTTDDDILNKIFKNFCIGK